MQQWMPLAVQTQHCTTDVLGEPLPFLVLFCGGERLHGRRPQVLEEVAAWTELHNETQGRRQNAQAVHFDYVLVVERAQVAGFSHERGDDGLGQLGRKNHLNGAFAATIVGPENLGIRARTQEI